jgi:hypothetical protein
VQVFDLTVLRGKNRSLELFSFENILINFYYFINDRNSLILVCHGESERTIFKRQNDY